MTDRVAGKVAFVTGAARGQGRSHAVRLAQEGADIIAVDICESIPEIPIYAGPTPDDLAETVRQVEALDRQIVATRADVRDFSALKAAFENGLAQLGRIDIVSANAGVFTFGQRSWEVTDEEWDAVNDINAKGVWHTCKAVIPALVDQGTGGSIVLTNSVAGLKGTPNVLAYTASKHAVLGIMRTLSGELGPHSIRVNSVHPTTVSTPMIQNQSVYRLFMPDEQSPTREAAEAAFRTLHTMPVPWVEPVDISNAVLFLASDEARYITGMALTVDAGALTK